MRSRPRSVFPNALLMLMPPFSRTLRFFQRFLGTPFNGRAPDIVDKAAIGSNRSWFLVAAYLLILYATLPIMPRIWNEMDSFLGGNGLWAIYAATGALLAILPAIMALRGVRSPRTYLAYAAFCFLLLALGTLEDNPGEKIHMLQYALLGILVHYALGEHRRREGNGARRLFAAILFCIAAGAVDEVIQYFLPGRSFTWHDVFVNGASGVLTMLVLAYCLPQARDSVYGWKRLWPTESQ